MLSSPAKASRKGVRGRHCLVAKYFFDLSHLLLYFPSDFFILAFGCQVRIVGSPTRLFFRFAFQLTKLALDLVLSARFHLNSSELLLRRCHPVIRSNLAAIGC